LIVVVKDHIETLIEMADSRCIDAFLM